MEDAGASDASLPAPTDPTAPTAPPPAPQANQPSVNDQERQKAIDMFKGDGK